MPNPRSRDNVASMIAAVKIPMRMYIEEFLEWDPEDGRLWQLVDGAPQAMAPTKRTHGALQGELARIIGNDLLERQSPCSVVIEPGIIPRVRSDYNFRIPDLAVTCSRYEAEESGLTDPVLVVDILSPSNQAETWANIWTYTTIPSVQEILVLHTTHVRAELLRRGPDLIWPEQPELIESGMLTLKSIDFQVELPAIYRTTRLAAAR
jgi:Uma2 family endonuclease